MQKITNKMELQIILEHLEEKQAAEWPLLKKKIFETYQALNPLNELKNTLKENISPDLLGTTMGLTAGYLTKKIIVGGSHNPIKKMLGALLEVGVLTFVSKNSDTIKFIVQKTVRLFSKQTGKS